MSLRFALYQCVDRHQLDAAQTRRLAEAAGMGQEPQQLASRLPQGIGILAAALGGLGSVFWVAANWQALGRPFQFALLQGLTALALLVTMLWPRGRIPFSLVALLATGALFAFFGQTYQTGADAWQLFALWALLTLPLCLAIGADIPWLPWTMIASTAIWLWMRTCSGHGWWADDATIGVHLAGWLFAGLLAAAMIAAGATWSWRYAWCNVLATVCASALAGLFANTTQSEYWLGLAVIAALSAGAHFVALGLIEMSVLGLAGNVLLVAGLARWMFHDRPSSAAIRLFALGLFAALLLAMTVKAIMQRAREVHA